MPYFTRLPASLREPLTCVCGSSDVKHTGDYHRHHWEYSFITANCVVKGPGRRHAMRYGGKSLIKRAILNYRKAFGLDSYSYEGIRVIIRGGNERAFWLSLYYTPSLGDGDSWSVCGHILCPIVKLGMNGWLQKYLQRYPGTVTTMSDSIRLALMARVLRSLDPVAIELMFLAGLDVSENAYHHAKGLYSRWVKSKGLETDPDEFDAAIKPILQKLREENPGRDWEWYNLLFPLPEFPKDPWKT